MRVDRLEAMVKGWFVGDFQPTAYATQQCEVAVKTYRAGDHEDWHYHKVATEITLVVSGTVQMGGARHGPGTILRLEPGERH